MKEYSEALTCIRSRDGLLAEFGSVVDAVMYLPMSCIGGSQQVSLLLSVLSHRSRALWFLGYHNIALADAERALREAREIGHAGTLMKVRGLHSVCPDVGVGLLLFQMSRAIRRMSLTGLP